MKKEVETKRRKNDRALRFYSEVLQLERLHYGLWDDSDPRTVKGLRMAQERYERRLVELIDPSVESVLDVGTGTGKMSGVLVSLGYDVEGVSPDVNQEAPFTEQTGGKRFYPVCFEDFEPEQLYDCLIFSESAQYIPLSKLLVAAKRCLKSGGKMIVADYFVKSDATGLMSKSGHNIDQFKIECRNHSFEIEQDLDITHQTVPTLELAKMAVDRYVLPTIEIFTEKIKVRRPKSVKLLGWIFRKKIAKIRSEQVLIDSEEFRRCKEYRIFVLRAP